MGKVFYLPGASLDLLEIHDYIAQDNPAAATRQVQAIAHGCQTLADMPGIGRERSDIRSGMRMWPVGAYLVLHRKVPGGVEVVRVVHGARFLDDVDLE